MRGVLCLFEAVAAGAADGYARMAAKPAATLKNILEAVKLISPPNAVVSFCK